MTDTTKALVSALQRAVNALEIISKHAGRRHQLDGQKTHLESLPQVRHYAYERAQVAREAMRAIANSPTPPEES